MSTHTPLIRLQAAKRSLELAQQNCPHWDYESDGCGYDCCREMDEADRELFLAKQAMEA
jgi:phage-related protein